jgi:hypothetical protein
MKTYKSPLRVWFRLNPNYRGATRSAITHWERLFVLMGTFALSAEGRTAAPSRGVERATCTT